MAGDIDKIPIQIGKTYYCISLPLGNINQAQNILRQIIRRTITDQWISWGALLMAGISALRDE